MKNVLLLTILLIIKVSSYGQNRIGIIGGGLYAKSNLTSQNEAGIASHSKSSYGNVYSYFGGLVYDIKVTNEFSIKSKLLFMNKGWTENTERTKDSSTYIGAFGIGTVVTPNETVKSKVTYLFNYLELPVNFTFYTSIGKSLLSFSAGPYVSYGLSGKYNFKAISSNKFRAESIVLRRDTVNNQITTFTTTVIRNDKDYIPDSSGIVTFKGAKNHKGIYQANRLDYGASIETSLELRMGISINAAYTVGVTNILNDRYGAIQNRNRVIMAGLSYYLKSKRKRA